MKNIIPFKKDIIFKTNLSEITSISLENTLALLEETIKGEFIISGEYKISDNSKTVEPFEINLPFEIMLDERYDTSNASVDIDDFYYEIINSNILSVSIDVLIDKLKEKPVMELNDIEDIAKTKEIAHIDEFEINDFNDKDDNRICEIEEENMTEEEQNVVDINADRENIEQNKYSIFNKFATDEEIYSTYSVVIMREGDSIDSILEKYSVTLEELKEYNDLSDLKLGDKLIIPCHYERD